MECLSFSYEMHCKCFNRTTVTSHMAIRNFSTVSGCFNLRVREGITNSRPATASAAFHHGRSPSTAFFSPNRPFRLSEILLCSIACAFSCLQLLYQNIAHPSLYRHISRAFPAGSMRLISSWMLHWFSSLQAHGELARLSVEMGKRKGLETSFPFLLKAQPHSN